MSNPTQPNERSPLTVAMVMSTALVTAEPMTTVGAAATIMGVNRVGSVLVLRHGALAGIVTERDILRAVSQHAAGPSDLVEHWMTRNPATISCRATLEAALDRMLAGGFRHLPVVEAASLIGLVSMRDLCRDGAGASCAADCARRRG